MRIRKNNQSSVNLNEEVGKETCAEKMAKSTMNEGLKLGKELLYMGDSPLLRLITGGNMYR